MARSFHNVYDVDGYSMRVKKIHADGRTELLYCVERNVGGCMSSAIRHTATGNVTMKHGHNHDDVKRKNRVAQLRDVQETDNSRETSPSSTDGIPSFRINGSGSTHQDIIKARGRGRPTKPKKDETSHRTGFDGETVHAWRKTVSIFKQPVTLVSTSKKESKVLTEENPQMKRKPIKKCDVKPMPAMWAKSLSGLCALVPSEMTDKISDIEKTEFLEETLHLSGRLQRAVSAMDEQATVATICHTLNNPINNGTFGQVADKQALETSFITSVTSDQPMIERVSMGQLNEDIVAQEKRVLDCRRRLQEVMKHFGGQS